MDNVRGGLTASFGFTKNSKYSVDHQGYIFLYSDDHSKLIFIQPSNRCWSLWDSGTRESVMKYFNWNEIEKFLEETSDTSKIYIGVDSVSHKKHGKWHATYYKVIVVHKDCLHGCKIFGEVETEEVY